MCHGCGHDWLAHHHYRQGRECVACDCPGWRSPVPALVARCLATVLVLGLVTIAVAVLGHG